MVMIYGNGTFDNYLAALAAVGVKAEVSVAPALARRCDGLLLPGGGDIFNSLSSEETEIIRTVLRRRCPVLGICRGMQALNVYFGGTLYEHIAGHQQSCGDMVHPTRAAGPAAYLLGARPAVTSNHHQAVKALGCGLKACQWSADGVVEAVFHKELPVLGVQYHPERQSFAQCRGDAADAGNLFRRWAEQLRQQDMKE